MPVKKKGTNKKLILAIVLVAVLVIATVAIIYATQSRSSSGNSKLVGVQVGDTFTYNITGSSSDPVPNTDYPGFYELNETQYYKVAVIGIEGPSVMLTTDWVFKNGTDVKQQQTIDLIDGMITDQYGFSFLYPANLKVNDPIYPVNNTVLVNETLTQTYASGPRGSGYYHVSTTEYYANDPTQSTQRQLYDEVYFDRQTGMLTSFDELQVYNNPEIELEVIYTLTSSTVWNV
jgi:hypothetical protein